MQINLRKKGRLNLCGLNLELSQHNCKINLILKILEILSCLKVEIGTEQFRLAISKTQATPILTVFSKHANLHSSSFLFSVLLTGL